MAVLTNKPTPFVAPLLALSRHRERYFPLIISVDSRNDILAAKAAGCPSACMTYRYNYGDAITLSHPDYVLKRFADLFPMLGLAPFDNQDV